MSYDIGPKALCMVENTLIIGGNEEMIEHLAATGRFVRALKECFAEDGDERLSGKARAPKTRRNDPNNLAHVTLNIGL